MLSPFSKVLFDLAEPVFSAARLSTSSQLTKTGKLLSIITLVNSTGLLSDGRHRQFSVISNFELYSSLVSLTAKLGDQNVFEIVQKDLGVDSSRVTISAEE